ncbi:fimbrial protein [Yersinia proxima]|uniref:Fimbrial protein n=2 Tax=Yersinia proxima TaxID=2890316 RepID=A0ABW9F486_9GAMM|nr:fimbrial protein [Yersinia proxima]
MLKILKIILIPVVISISLMSVPAIAASCSGPEHQAFVSIGQLNPATDGVSGTIIGSQRISIPELNYNCGQNVLNSYTANYTRPTAGQSSIRDVYTTEIPGLGIKIIWPVTRATAFPLSYNCSNNCTESADELLIEFIQIGRISAGTIPSGKIADVVLKAVNETSNTVTLLTISLATDINIVSKACMVENPEISVDLGSYSISDFQGTSKQGDKIPFNIYIKCPQNSSVKIAFQVADQQPVGSATGFIANTIPASSGGAKGIGTKMLSANGITAQGVTGGLSNAYSIDAGTTEILKYNAQMFITDRANITSGNVAGRVYFNLTIQ